MYNLAEAALRNQHTLHQMQNLQLESPFDSIKSEAERWVVWLWMSNPTSKLDSIYRYVASCGATSSYTVKATPNNLCAFTGKVTFEQGDMITEAAVAAATAGSKVGLLNMANARRYGGGFCGGARAQEEQLCHRSTLYPRLKVDALSKTRPDSLYPIEPGSAIVTDDVDILLDANFQPIEPKKVTVISAAAKHYETEEEALNDPNLHRRMFKTWTAIFAAAKEAKIKTLIVSAIGAGAFHNPADCVAEAFLRAKEHAEFGNELTHIRMIVFDDHNSNQNVARMQKVIGV